MNKRLIAIIVVAIAVGVIGRNVYAENAVFELREKENFAVFCYWQNTNLEINGLRFMPLTKLMMAEIGFEYTLSTKESEEEAVETEPRYGVDFSTVRNKYPNRPFVKEVLTPEMEDFLNKKEIETGIPGAVIMAQAIWEVGWSLNTPKGGSRDSKNLFNIKNCDGNYVTMAGAKWQCYESYQESVEAYIKLITTQPRYSKAYEYIKNGGEVKKYYSMLGEAGYFEAPKEKYASNCENIMKENCLVKKGTV